ncbi:UDP-glycosyltransferase 72B3 [Camellia lanceoleosa]|uniref:UDP-glycosyltransferase 72B3 n=1 Tax=Camellia lanceoleosa TaxID=1840588 RepID=A0ACC0IMD8_9ERIC|nr:UDP-glycosyltransferase 72B3 [Camellia lanceoleosa]
MEEETIKALQAEEPDKPSVYLGRDLPESFQDRSVNAYKKLINNVKQFRSAEGIIVNSFVDMEEETIKALQAEEPDKPSVYRIGPLIQVDSSDGLDQSKCL